MPQSPKSAEVTALSEGVVKSFGDITVSLADQISQSFRKISAVAVFPGARVEPFLGLNVLAHLPRNRSAGLSEQLR